MRKQKSNHLTKQKQQKFIEMEQKAEVRRLQDKKKMILKWEKLGILWDIIKQSHLCMYLGLKNVKAVTFICAMESISCKTRKCLNKTATTQFSDLAHSLKYSFTLFYLFKRSYGRNIPLHSICNQL